MVFTLNVINDDLAGENPITLFIEIESDIEIAEIFFVKRIFTDPQIKRAPVALVAF